VRDLRSASREELLELIAILLARVEALEARVAELEEENRRLRGGGGKAVPAWVKPNRPPREEKPRKPRGQGFVRRREPADEVREHAVAECPECGRKLTGGWVHRRRQVIEIELVRRVVEHVVMGRRCGICGERRLPTLDPAELGVQGKRRFGVGVQSLVAMLHGRHRVPMREIGAFLEEGWGLHVSEGEIVGLLDGVAEAGQSAVEELREEVRRAGVVCVDETGWRQDGRNGWVWTFSTPDARYFEFHPTRSGRVPEEMLGKDFGGIVTCDCYVGYNRLEAEKQRCWAHLLRDLHALKETHPEQPAVQDWAQAIQGLHREAEAFRSANPRRRRKQRRELEARLDALVRAVARDPSSPHRVLAERMRQHLLEWFVFVEHPEVPATNNLAERSLRPTVIARKISGGTRSDKGSTTKTRLLSLFGTWKLRRQRSLATCQDLLLADSP
jgi:transposase